MAEEVQPSEQAPDIDPALLLNQELDRTRRVLTATEQHCNELTRELIRARAHVQHLTEVLNGGSQ